MYTYDILGISLQCNCSQLLELERVEKQYGHSAAIRAGSSLELPLKTDPGITKTVMELKEDTRELDMFLELKVTLFHSVHGEDPSIIWSVYI